MSPKIIGSILERQYIPNIFDKIMYKIEKYTKSEQKEVLNICDKITKYFTHYLIKPAMQYIIKPLTKNTRNMINQIAKIFRADGLTDLIQSISVDEMLKDKIICFDDFERTSIDTQELLGFLQDLKENRNCKIILIYNEVKLDTDKKTDFDKYREKVIDKDFNYTPTPTQTVALAFSGTENDKNPFHNIQDYQHHIAEKCTDLNLNNIRIIQKILNHISNNIQPALQKVNWCFDIYPNIKNDVTEHIISTFILYSILHYSTDNYKKGTLEISKEDFENHFKGNPFDDTQYKDLNADEKRKKQDEKQEWFSNFIGQDFAFYGWIKQQPEIKTISSHIIHLIKSGYLLEEQKKDLIKNMMKFNIFKANNIDRNEKEAHWSKTAKERHNKFLDVDYPQRFYDSIKNVVKYQSIENIDFAVRFLEEHGMHEQKKTIIESFIDREDYKELIIPSYLDESYINTMDSDFKTACENRCQELHNKFLNKISLKESLTKILINHKGFNPEDGDKVKNATKDEIKELLLSLTEDSAKHMTIFVKHLIECNPENTIQALYEIYIHGNNVRKKQICSLFKSKLNEILNQNNLNQDIKDKIKMMLNASTV